MVRKREGGSMYTKRVALLSAVAGSLVYAAWDTANLLCGGSRLLLQAMLLVLFTAALRALQVSEA